MFLSFLNGGGLRRPRMRVEEPQPEFTSRDTNSKGNYEKSNT
jgi:hypothetical protein